MCASSPGRVPEHGFLRGQCGSGRACPLHKQMISSKANTGTSHFHGWFGHTWQISHYCSNVGHSKCSPTCFLTTNHLWLSLPPSLSLSLFPLSFLIFLISTPLLVGSAESRRMPCSAQGAVEDLHSSWTQHLLGEQTGSLPHPCSHSPKSKFWCVQLPELPQELSAAARGNGNILSEG